MIFNFWGHIEAEILVRNDDNSNEYKWSKMENQESICEACENAENNSMELYICNERGFINSVLKEKKELKCSDCGQIEYGCGSDCPKHPNKGKNK